MMQYGLTTAITFVVLINILSEGFSIIVLLFFLPKEKIEKIVFSKFWYQKCFTKSIAQQLGKNMIQNYVILVLVQEMLSTIIVK